MYTGTRIKSLKRKESGVPAKASVLGDPFCKAVGCYDLFNSHDTKIRNILH